MKKKIIIAPLNWGLGHATRCIPIINALIKNNFTPIIASDGDALAFLKKEFPDSETLKLPSYHIKYGKNLKWSLFLQAPKIIRAVKKERLFIENYVYKHKDVVGIISDNRFGVRSTIVPSVYITHQLRVLSGFSTFLTSKIHQNSIKKFDECWIPDNENSSFSGRLSILKNNTIKNRFIGVLSRFKPKNESQNIDVLIIASGVEFARKSFVQKLKKEFKNYLGNVVLVEGKIESVQKKSKEKNIKTYNFMLSEELENAIDSAKIVVCRSGYSSIMDLAVLQKKVFFVPTKGQFEQEYLASYLEHQKNAPFSSEEKFNISLLKKIENYSGLSSKKTELSQDLFSLFHSK